MADIVNLRLARKAKARGAAEDAAAANRAKFGRTKGGQAATDAENTRLQRELDGAKRED